MIFDNYDDIAHAHAKIFAQPETVSAATADQELDADEAKSALAEMTDQEIMDLLAAICELIN